MIHGHPDPSLIDQPFAQPPLPRWPNGPLYLFAVGLVSQIAFLIWLETF